MDKTILVAGKDIPAGSDFAAAFAIKGRTTITSAQFIEKIETITENGYTAISWNRSSALSARALILGSVNVSNHLDEAVLFFDETQFAMIFAQIDQTEIVRVVDELITGYQYLAQEILARFEQKRMRGEELQSGKLVFLRKTNPSQADVAVNPAVRGNGTLSSPLLAAAAAAFKAFAENIAALYAESQTVYPVLVTCDATIEVAHKDSSLGSWLCDYLDSIDTLKKRPAPKQLVSWIKAGTKRAGGFGIF